MKNILKPIFSAALVVTFFAACDKVGDLPFYENGSPVTLSSDVDAIAPTPDDAENIVVTFSWTDPAYATKAETVKYIVQIDAAGNNFAHPAEKTVSGELETSFTGEEINEILLGYGYAFNVAYDMEVRVISSYANNNDRLFSANTLTIPMTAYKIPPKVQLPEFEQLFLVGDASLGGWNNPVPLPAQEFARLDETTYAGVFNLYGGKQYLVLPVNGSWDHKYSVEDNTIPGLAEGGDFGYDLPSNFPGPAADGQYLITLDFQFGKFTVTPYTGSLPTELFLVGDATYGGWNNPVPVPDQQFTRINSSQFEITAPMYGGKQYLMLPVNGSWDHKYSVDDNTLPGLAEGGDFGYDKPSNFPGPANDGTYKIEVNFATNKFKVTAE